MLLLALINWSTFGNEAEGAPELLLEAPFALGLGLGLVPAVVKSSKYSSSSMILSKSCSCCSLCGRLFVHRTEMMVS